MKSRTLTPWWVRTGSNVPAIFSFVVTLALLVSMYTIWHQGQLNKLTAMADNLSSVLQQEMDKKSALLQAIGDFLDQNSGDESKTYALVSAMFEQRQQAFGDAFQYAPDGIITKSIPIAGYEGAIGLNLLTHNNNRNLSKLAIDEHRLKVLGPFRAVQGWRAIIFRQPVFLTRENGRQQFWGFVQIVQKLDRKIFPLLKALTEGDRGMIYRIRHNKEIIDSNHSQSSIEDYMLEKIVKLPGGSVWHVGVDTKNRLLGSANHSLIYIAIALSFVVAFLVRMGWKAFTGHYNLLLENNLLENQRMAAESASSSKSVFLANMSHEIRTPLTATIGLLQLLSQSELTEEQYKQLSQAQNSSRMLLDILNQILDFSKIEAGKIHLENVPFSPADMISQIDALLRAMAEKKSIVFDVELPGQLPNRLSGDVSRLTQILVNLLGNAIKFTESGCVCLKIKAKKLTANESGQVQWQIDFSVEDTGIGISDDRLETIFESFEQAEKSTTRKYGGTGLGLAISKCLVQAMGGELLVQSQLGKGSRFFFSLSLPEAKPVTTSETINTLTVDFSQNDLLAGLHILLVEDNSALQKVIVALLKSQKANVALAENGLQAIELVSQLKNLDLVLMDIQMPVMDGHEATRQIREQFTQQELPILAMTASALPEDYELALKNGMNGYLVKPVELKHLITELLERNILSKGGLGHPLTTVKSSSIEENKPTQSAIDVKAAIARMGNMPDIYQDLVLDFVDMAPEFIGSLATSSRAGDAVALQKNLHALKGVVSQLGAFAFSDWLKEKMKVLRSGVESEEMLDIGMKAAQRIEETLDQLRDFT